MQYSQLLKITPGTHVTTEAVDHIENNKPAIFIFEGAEVFDLPYSARADNHYMAKFAAQNVKNPEDYNFYTIQTEFFMHNVRTLGQYNDDPHNFCSPLIKELVEKVMLEKTPDITSLNGAEREAAVNATKKTLSRQMAIGYSLGAGMIQEMTNGLHHALLDKGFKPKEIKACVECFSAGTLCCSVTLLDKPINAPQLHTLIASDGVVHWRSHGQNLVADDKILHPYLNSHKKGNNLAIVGTPIMPEAAYGLETYASKLHSTRAPAPITQDNDNTIPCEARAKTPAQITNPVRKKGENPKPDWVLQIQEREVKDHHDLYLNSNTDRQVRPDLRTYGFNAGANIFWEGMQRMMQSAKAGYGNKDYTPPTTILENVKHEFLTPDTKDKAIQKVRESIKAYEGDIQWIRKEQAPPQRG